MPGTTGSIEWRDSMRCFDMLLELTSVSPTMEPSLAVCGGTLNGIQIDGKMGRRAAGGKAQM